MTPDTPDKKPRRALETLVVHGGEFEARFHPVTPPIYQTSTFAFRNVDEGADRFAGRGEGFIYSRMGNPTVQALERCVAELEGGAAALATGSGMAAVYTALGALLKQGDHLILSQSVYGPTCTLAEEILPNWGIETSVVDTSDLRAVNESFRPNTRVLMVETPGNPTLVVSDLRALAAMAQERGVALVVDNTFLSPVLQRPIALGADVVIHSLTKFLNGHADVVGGMIVLRDQERYPAFRKMLNHMGGVLPPFESFLVLRGIRTLALRMGRHCESALEVARFLEGHPAVAWVRYPGLPSHPQYALSQRQTMGGGGLVSFELRGGLEAGKTVMNHVRLWALAVSLGGVESLIQHPASMTHASMGPEARRRAGISDGLVRLSVGIESVSDLIADLGQALAVVEGAPRREPQALR